MRQKIQAFPQFFQGHENDYVIIGGTAAMLWLESMGGQARATKDIDLVLLVKGKGHPFYKRLWEFVHAGGYKVKQRSDGKPCFYRFTHPRTESYPEILELFAEADIDPPRGQYITPIPTGDDISSLSAIILDHDYYSLLQQGMSQLEGVSILDAYHLIPLKAKAWLDLSAKREGGTGHVDSNDIKKHRNDILKLGQLLPPGSGKPLPPRIVQDVHDFLQQQTEQTFNPSQILGKGKQPSFAEAIEHLKKLYGIQ